MSGTEEPTPTVTPAPVVTPVAPPVAVGDVLAGAVAAIGAAGHAGGRVDGRAEGRVDGRAGPEGRPATCRRCGDAAFWHPTPQGKWILMQPDAVPCHLVPAGSRFRIGSDGTAVNLGRAIPADTCRISHFDICPADPAPHDPYLLQLWHRTAARRGYPKS